MKTTCMTTLMSCLALLILASPAVAGPIDLRTAAGTSTDTGTPGVSTVWASSRQEVYRGPANVSNGNGMTWTDPAWTGGDASGTHGTNPYDYHMWMTDYTAPSTQFIGWNLGAVYTLEKMHVWNYNESTLGDVRGISGLDIQTSVDGTTWVTVQSGVDWSGNEAPGTAGYAGFDHALTGITTQYIRFANLEAFGGSPQFAGLSEVVFYETGVVPEPSTLALAGLGLVGLIGWGLRRRKG